MSKEEDFIKPKLQQSLTFQDFINKKEEAFFYFSKNPYLKHKF